MLVMLFTSVSLASCSDDDKDDDPTTKDPASKIAGTYVGSGNLLYIGIPVENYPGMKFVLTKSSNEYVLVNPKTADGEDFFQRAAVYQITQTAKGDFNLRNNDSPNIMMTIDRKGNLSYSNPNVSVGDDSGYTLTFEGSKE